MSWVVEDHEWEQDPEHAGEGLRCVNCGVTEAEHDRYPGSCSS